MSRAFVKSLAAKAGMAPGTPVYVGEREGAPASLSFIEYSGSGYGEGPVSVENLNPPGRESRVVWVNLCGLSGEGLVQELCDRFGIHPLAQEDILHTSQRPRVDIYKDHIYMVLMMVTYDDTRRVLDTEQVSLVLGDGFVITFQEREGDVFEPVRDRIRGGGRIRALGADYLAYSLMDAVVDNYFTALEKMGDRVEEIEDAVLERPETGHASAIHLFRRELFHLRRAVWPLREALATLTREAPALISPGMQPYMRDLHDHAIQVMDTVETFRDTASGLLDVYLSSVSNRMNQIMKVLTVIATIFIPLTFIVGVYGMNFRHIPELEYPWAYPAVLALCVVIAVGMTAAFRRKGWF
jgi:magnesium transporter